MLRALDHACLASTWLCHAVGSPRVCYYCFFFNDPPTTEIYTLSLHDALPICHAGHHHSGADGDEQGWDLRDQAVADGEEDRKSTRLNSSHRCISYAVFCLKKKKWNVTIRNIMTNPTQPLSSQRHHQAAGRANH